MLLKKVLKRVSLSVFLLLSSFYCYADTFENSHSVIGVGDTRYLQLSGSTLSGYIHNYPETNQNASTTLGINPGGAFYVGKRITNGTSYRTVDKCKFYLKKDGVVGTPTGNAVVQIYSIHTVALKLVPNVLLATSDNFDVSTLTTSLSYAEFTFSGVNRIVLSPNTDYAFIIYYNGGDTNNYLDVRSYTGGAAVNTEIDAGVTQAWDVGTNINIILSVYYADIVQTKSEKNVASGYVGLDANSRINPSGVMIDNTPVDSDLYTWIDDKDLHAKFPTGFVVVGSYLFGLTKDTRYGTLAFNGKSIREAAATKNHCSTMFTDGTNVYATAASMTRVTAHKRAGSLTFTQGEAVTQETTGATGWYIRDDGTNYYFMLATGSAAFVQEGTVNAYTITGTSSGATVEPDVITNETGYCFLEMSTDGFAAYKPVLDLNGGPYPHSFVAAYSGATRVNFIANVSAVQTTPSTIWYNYPDSDSNWTLLISTAVNSIRHIHGFKYIPGVNGTATNRLIMMTGDNDDQSSILVCDDITDLIANPGTWKTRWGLDVSGATRTTYLTVTNTAYNYGDNNQQVRTVEFLVNKDKTAAYYLPDESRVDGTLLRKVDLIATVGPTANTTVGRRHTISEGSIGLTTSNGAMILTTFGNGYHPTGNGDGYYRAYVVVPSIDDVKMLWAKPVLNYAVIPDATTPWLERVVEFPLGSSTVNSSNSVWFTPLINYDYGIAGDSVVGKVVAAGEGLNIAQVADTNSSVSIPTVNIIGDGRFQDCWSGTDFVQYKTGWLTINADVTAAKETTLIDTISGNTASLKVIPTSSGGSYYQLTIPQHEINQVKGGFVTVRGRMLWNDAGATGNIILGYTSTSLGTSSYSPSNPIPAVSSSWQTVEFHGYIPMDTTALNIKLYARSSGAGTTPVYFSDVQLMPGSWYGITTNNLPTLVGSGKLTTLNVGATAGGNSALQSYLDGTNNNGILGVNCATPKYVFSVGSNNDSGYQWGTYGDGTDFRTKWDKGIWYIATDEATNTNSSVKIIGKGTGYGILTIGSANAAVTGLSFSYLDITNTAAWNIQSNGSYNVSFFTYGSSKNPYVYIYGNKSGTNKSGYLRVGTGGDFELGAQAGESLSLISNTSIKAGNNVVFGTAANGVVLKQGANGKYGTFIANGITPVTVSNTSVAITDTIVFSLNTVGGTVGAYPAIQTITAATGFTVACTALDTSTYNYCIISSAA